MLRRLIKQLMGPLILTVICAGLVSWAYLNQPAFLEVMELKTYDLRLLARGPQPVSGQVVLVAIDEASLERVGRWPWSRRTMAALVDAMDAMEPRAVGYDIGFFDPETSGAQEELMRLAENARPLGLLPNPELVAYIRERLRQSNPDYQLALSLNQAAAPQVLGYYFNFAPDGYVTPKPEAATHTMAYAARYPAIRDLGTSAAPAAHLPVPHAPGLRTNVETIVSQSAGQGYFNVLPDQDGVIRRYPMTIRFQNVYYQPLAAAVFNQLQAPRLPTLLAARQGVVGAQWGELHIPTDQYGQMLLNYRGPEKTLTHVAAWRILNGDVPAETLRGKLLLVGVTAPAVFDLRVTPFGVAYPGLEIQGTALENLISQDFMLRPGWAPLFDLAAIWLLALICLLFLWQTRPLLTLLGFMLMALGFVWLNQYLFTSHSYWLNMVYPLSGFSASYLMLNIYRFLFADRQKRQIRMAFSKYLDPNVVEQLVTQPERLKLGGEMLTLSVLFSDIRGFTSISEKLGPEPLVKLLNEYLTGMTGVVLRNRGLLDKYIGDAIMAVYGAPLFYAGHAAAACHTAVEMLAHLKTLNQNWSDRGLPTLEIGVGINSGPMVAGNMGSEQRFDYTVMGDHVNLASRLESLNKSYGTRILISQYTQSLIQDEFYTRPVDLVRVKGKVEPVEIYELLDLKSNVAVWPGQDEYLRMLSDYREGAFGRARTRCDDLLRQYPEDTVVRVYQTRLQQLAADPPAGWDGVYVFTTK